MSKDKGIVTLTMFMHQTVMVPLKSIMAGSAGDGGFKNAVVYGVLMGYDDSFVHIGDGVNVTTAIPRGEVGTILTGGSEFHVGGASEFDGPESEEEIQ